jgi:anti-sigma factor RsiW
MIIEPPDSRLSDEALAELVAFADGWLDDPSRQAAVAARVAACPWLMALVEQQRRVAAVLREAAVVTAPPQLRRRLRQHPGTS